MYPLAFSIVTFNLTPSSDAEKVGTLDSGPIWLVEVSVNSVPLASKNVAKNCLT